MQRTDFGELGVADALCGEFARLAFEPGDDLERVGHILFRLRNMQSLNTQRTVMAVLLVAAIPIGVTVPAYVSLTILVTMLILLIAYEGVKYREVRHHLRHHAD